MELLRQKLAGMGAKEVVYHAAIVLSVILMVAENEKVATAQKWCKNSSDSKPTIKVVMSGIQPTGVPHLGNLFGAIEHWRNLQGSSHDTNMIIGVCDLHSITVPQNPDNLRRNIMEMMASLLACGIDNNKTILFQQSAADVEIELSGPDTGLKQESIPAHANLNWVLGCLASIAKLQHLPQWKEKYASDEGTLGDVPLGLFTYPILQAADILIYRATHVPVGDDQLKHIELARYLAKAFNNKYGYLFPQPQSVTVEFKRIRSLRNPESKMSKSDRDPLSRIVITDSADKIREKIRKAVTDCTPNITYNPIERPGVSNLVDILSACTDRTADEIVESSLHLDTVGFKERMAEAVVEKLSPIRSKYMELSANMDYLQTVIRDGNDKAASIANNTYDKVKRLVGFV